MTPMFWLRSAHTILLVAFAVAATSILLADILTGSTESNALAQPDVPPLARAIPYAAAGAFGWFVLRAHPAMIAMGLVASVALSDLTVAVLAALLGGAPV